MATKTFNVATGSANTAGNWSPSGVPVAGDTVVIPSGKCPTSGDVYGTFSIVAASGADYGTTIFWGNGSMAGYPRKGVFKGTVTDSSWDVGIGTIFDGTVHKTRWGANSITVNGTLIMNNDGQTGFCNLKNSTINGNVECTGATFEGGNTLKGVCTLNANVNIYGTNTFTSTSSIVLNGGSLTSGVIQTNTLTFNSGTISVGTWSGNHTLTAGKTVSGGTWTGNMTVDGGSLSNATVQGSITYISGTLSANVTITGNVTLYTGDSLTGCTVDGNLTVNGGSVSGVSVTGTMTFISGYFSGQNWTVPVTINEGDSMDSWNTSNFTDLTINSDWTYGSGTQQAIGAVTGVLEMNVSMPFGVGVNASQIDANEAGLLLTSGNLTDTILNAYADLSIISQGGSSVTLTDVVINAHSALAVVSIASWGSGGVYSTGSRINLLGDHSSAAVIGVVDDIPIYYETSKTFTGVGDAVTTAKAEQLETDQADVTAKSDSIDEGAFIVGVEGTGMNSTTMAAMLDEKLAGLASPGDGLTNEQAAILEGLDERFTVERAAKLDRDLAEKADCRRNVSIDMDEDKVTIE
jgi:hypothetical protein